MLMAAALAANGERELFADDFSKLPAGWLSSPVGTFRIDPSTVTVFPSALTLRPKQQQTLTFTVPNPAPPGGTLLAIGGPEADRLLEEVLAGADENLIALAIEGLQGAQGEAALEQVRKILAQPTKQGWLYTFDRVTGQPIWPIVERQVPQSDVPGEGTSPTQPFVTKPPPYSRTYVAMDDLIDFTPALRQQALNNLKP